MDADATFQDQVRQNITGLQNDDRFRGQSLNWIRDSVRHNYSYNFTSQGRPIIQYPQDMVAIQELIWSIRPDLIIETGIAHGGSLVMSAAMLALNEYCDAAANGQTVDPASPTGIVLGIDIDIRAHNRRHIETHPLAGRIRMIEGSSIDPQVVAQVSEIAADYSRILVLLDSNHTHEHVLGELNAYASLVSVGSYCVVFDTIIEDLPANSFPDRPWDIGNNPKTAVHEFVEANADFQIDHEIDAKLQISVAPHGFLRRTQ